VPFLLGYALAWWMIVVANVLLGLNQGLTWSMAVNMKIDLVGPRERGLAMGLNEAAGYTALGATALATGYIASVAGLRPQPFWLGVAYAAAGLALSALAVRDTRGQRMLRPACTTRTSAAPGATASRPPWPGWWPRPPGATEPCPAPPRPAWSTTSTTACPGACCPCSLPVPASARAHRHPQGRLPHHLGPRPTHHRPPSDRIGRKPLIVSGMLVQAIGLVVVSLGLAHAFVSGLIGSTLLGLGTALVYPALLAAIGDAAHPTWRATSLGVYRTWRDLGYAVGALMAGLVAQALSLVCAVHIAAALTCAAALVVWRFMSETLARPRCSAARGGRASPEQAAAALPSRCRPDR
jgi:MFS family permease